MSAIRSHRVFRAGLGGALLALTAWTAQAATNPREFIKVASEQLRLREVSRVVEVERTAQPGWRRATILAEVVEVRRARALKPGDRILIDWTVDPTELAAEGKRHAAAAGEKIGRPFMHEPEPPALDARREFWANLAPAGGSLGNVNRFAGARVNLGGASYTGSVFVPVAGQYSFMAPASAAP